MALNTVKLNGGTAGNPVVLSARQIKGLIALYKDSNVTKDCSGYVKAASGKLAKSEYIYIQNLGFTIVDTTTTPDIFTLYAANNNILYEGKSVQLYSTGLDIKDLVFKVIEHEIVINSGAISEEVIKSRIHISETGLVTVDDAEENATWQDIITIQAYPSFDPTNKVLISNPITIKGVAMSGISITAANSVIIGGRINVEVNILPVDHSKNNYRLDIYANDGTINNNIYIAPDTPIETAIVAECFLFGGNVANFHVEKNISVKKPIIICDIKDKDGEEVPGAYISVTDGVTQIITQLSNGENMTAVLNRTYTIKAFVPEGYTKAIYPESITPKEVETIVTATYFPLQLGVMAVFKDGSYIPYDEWLSIGAPKTNEGYPLIGGGIIQSNGDKYVSCFDLTENKFNGTEIQINAIQVDLDGAYSIDVARAIINTNVISSISEESEYNCAAKYCKSKIIEIGGVEKIGFLGGLTHISNMISSENLPKLNDIRKSCNLNTLPNINNAGGQAYLVCSQKPNSSKTWAVAYNKNPGGSAFNWDNCDKIQHCVVLHEF